jgi:SAM-dependent methyltransferase
MAAKDANANAGPKSWHGLLLTSHIAASVGVLGADLGLLVLGLAGIAGAPPESIYPAARLIVQSLVMPLALAALATGVSLAVSTPWGLFRYWWVAIKLVITLLLTAAVLFVLLPALSAAADSVTTSTGGLRVENRMPLALAPAVASSLLLLAVALAVFKPPWRLLSRRKTGRREPPRAIGFPHLYDLVVKILTRGREHEYRERVLDLAGLQPGDDVLDVGCGSGTQALAAWHRIRPGGSVTGTDVSGNMLAVARRKARRAGAAVTFLHGDAGVLPLEDESFDAVLFTTVLHMLPEARWERCLGEAHRVLRAGGRLLLVDYAGDPQSRRHFSAKVGPHGRFDLDRLRVPLVETGFRSVNGGTLDWMSLSWLRGVR